MVATIKDITEESAPQKREVIAESPAMRDVLNFVRRVAASEAIRPAKSLYTGKFV